MMAHTPTPWRVEDGTTLIWGKCDPDDKTTYGMGYPVARLEHPYSSSRLPTPEEQDANAALIVNAVNNHDDLLAALKAVRPILAEYAKELIRSYCRVGADGQPLRETLDLNEAESVAEIEGALAQTDAVLARVEGGGS